MKKTHPDDLYEEVLIRTATSFTVHFRKGPRETYREDAPTLEDARRVAAQMNRVHGEFGRRAGIYALVNRESIFVPDTFQG